MTRRRLAHTATVALIAAAAGAISGCDVFKRQASEGDSMVGVGVEGRIADVVQPIVGGIFDERIYTPQPERRFAVEYVPDDSLALVTSWQNVVLLGALESDDGISRRVRRMLSDEALDGVRDGELRVFRQQDVWVRGQTVVVAVAPTRGELAAWLKENGAVIYDILREDRYARMKKHLYARLEQKEIADSLRKAHGWYFRIPHDFTIVASERDPSFVRFRRPFPDRFITIAWKLGTPDSISVDALVRWRDRLGRTYPDTSRTNPAILDSAWTTLGGVDALAVHGIWETIGPAGGGPYLAYLLHKDGTLYLLDGKVYAPDRRKGQYVRQLETIFSTFEP